MLQKSRIWFLCAIMVLSFLVPASSHADAGSLAGVIQQNSAEQAPSCENVGGEKTLSLEEIEKLVGPQRMCQIFCGRNDPTVTNCTLACGDAAFCFYGSCVYK